MILRFNQKKKFTDRTDFSVYTVSVQFKKERERENSLYYDGVYCLLILLYIYIQYNVLYDVRTLMYRDSPLYACDPIYQQQQ